MAKSPNPARGEIAIDLGDERFILRPTFDCLERIEAGTGKSVSALYDDLARGDGIGANALLVIVGEGIEAGGVAMPESLGERIYNEGFLDIIGRAVDFLASALVGPITRQGAIEQTSDPEPGRGRWREVALSAMNWSPSEFNGATPHEFWAAHEGIKASQPSEKQSDSQNVNRRDPETRPEPEWTSPPTDRKKTTKH